eukprot:3326191-Prorocentrum_lima.AAC.1
MEHRTYGAEIIPSTQGYEPNMLGLELVVAHRLTVLPQEGQHDPQGVADGDGMSPLMHANVVEYFQRVLGSQ